MLESRRFKYSVDGWQAQILEAKKCCRASWYGMYSHRAYETTCNLCPLDGFHSASNILVVVAAGRLSLKNWPVCGKSGKVHRIEKFTLILAKALFIGICYVRVTALLNLLNDCLCTFGESILSNIWPSEDFLAGYDLLKGHIGSLEARLTSG